MKHGFYLTAYHRTFFFVTSKEYVCKYVICKMIDQICKTIGKSKSYANQCKENDAERKAIKNMLLKAQIVDRKTPSGYQYYEISGNKFTEIIPKSDDTLIIFY